jgi:hypothetical protein
MRSNTASQGVDPAGAFSPAENEFRRPLTWRWLVGLVIASALLAGAIISAVL